MYFCGSILAHQVCGEDRRIPLLEELFQAFPQTPINIDIKIDSDELIQKVWMWTLNMLKCFKYYKSYIHILNCILGLDWPK